MKMAVAQWILDVECARLVLQLAFYGIVLAQDMPGLSTIEIPNDDCAVKTCGRELSIAEQVCIDQCAGK